MPAEKQVQIDEATWLANQGVVTAVNQMLSNPEARKLLLEARQKVDPKAVIPERVALAPVESALKEEREARLALEKKIADKEAKDESDRKISEFKSAWDKAKADIKAQHGLTDEGIAAIEKHAETEGIPNLRAAANDWLALHPPSRPEQPTGYGSFNFFEPSEKEDETMKKLLESRGENEGMLNRKINETLQEIRGVGVARR